MFDFRDSRELTDDDLDRIIDLLGLINGKPQFSSKQFGTLTRIPILLANKSQALLDIWNSDERRQPDFATDWKTLQMIIVRRCRFRGFLKIDDKRVYFFKTTQRKVDEANRFIWLSEDKSDFWTEPIGKPDEHYNEFQDQIESWPDVPVGPSGYLRASFGSVLKTRTYEIVTLETSVHCADLDPYAFEDLHDLQKLLKSALSEETRHKLNKNRQRLRFDTQIEILKTKCINQYRPSAKQSEKVKESSNLEQVLSIFANRKSSNPSTVTDKSSPQAETHEEPENMQSSSDEGEFTMSRKTKKKLVYTSSEESDCEMDIVERETLYDDNFDDTEVLPVMPMISEAEFRKRREKIEQRRKSRQENVTEKNVSTGSIVSDDENDSQSQISESDVANANDTAEIENDETILEKDQSTEQNISDSDATEVETFFNQKKIPVERQIDREEFDLQKMLNRINKLELQVKTLRKDLYYANQQS